MRILLLIMVLFISLHQPSNAQILDAIKGAIANKKRKKVKKKDQGITSTLHEKNVGKIVWSNSKISLSNENEAALQTKFNATDFIYGRVYASHSIENHPIYLNDSKIYCSTCRIYYVVYIDGEKQSWPIKNNILNEDQQTWTTRQVWISTKREQNGIPSEWKDIIKNLSVGNHTIKVELHVSEDNYFDKEPIAAGEFILVKESEDDIFTIGKTFDDYEAKMKDEVLEKEILEAIQNNAKEHNWKETFVMIKIKNKDWSARRNEYSGIITGRRITAYCYATWPDGKCSVQEFAFMQSYNGEKYTETVYLAFGDRYYVDCTK